ncbi:MAG: hypothetical protein NVSMB56_06370 [Pyrinomonadaceae bacterium]
MGAGQIEFRTNEKNTEALQSFMAKINLRFPPEQSRDIVLDWRAVIARFPRQPLARALFVILENARIEHRLRIVYKGVSRELDLLRAWRRNTRMSDGRQLENFAPFIDRFFHETLSASSNSKLDDRAIETSPCQDQNRTTKAREVIAENISTETASVVDTLRACLILYDYVTASSDENVSPVVTSKSLSLQSNKRRTQPRKAFTIPVRTDDDVGRESGDMANVFQSSTVESQAKRVENIELIGEPLPVADNAANAAHTFHYDEWDATIQDYRSRWCRVVENNWQPADMNFAVRTFETYRGVISQVRNQFELIRPTGMRKMRGQLDGDDFDLEALTELVADRRARLTPSERIYIKRRNMERDVAVCFLLDMSGSTNKRVTPEKSILDVEKESLLLMCEALQAVGDAYAIYGFSGRARQGVSFFRFKEFGEPYDERVRQRIGAARGLSNTRLGAAIRHATWRLNRQPSATRLLIVLSDARPSDEDYNDTRYTREDTRIALQEARAFGVTPFFITFGQDEIDEELDKMFEDTGYMIIDDVLGLPERLPGIYRKLTT